ncbi:MAG TPA: PIN domain-containing protein [Thermoanaerobaculia bacterium]|nr:PIN domain-containing protein [Thermoanaerobaculia bacterium]
MIVADTGAVLALIDADERNHKIIRDSYESDPESWRLPWAILPEVDYLLSTRVGKRAEEAFLEDLSSGVFVVEWGDDADLKEAQRICRKHKGLGLGLVDAVVIAVAERLHADAIATLDLRHFGTVRIAGNPRLLPRDL